MKKVKVGVFGVGRGGSMMGYCKRAENAELVAVCDQWEEGLLKKKKDFGDDAISYYTSFDEFIRHDMDAVVLANYANEHAPFAVKCLQHGKHVMSEVLPVNSMAEAVALVEAVEGSKAVYAYAENYCFMPAPYRMRELYRQGVLGEFEYGEGEYLHNCESIWPSITQNGNPNHWRKTMYATFYCTHSLGPLIHITGLRPVSVTGFEMPVNARMKRMGANFGHTAVEMVTLENGAVVKSIHGIGCSRNSIWYLINGSKGSMESARETAGEGVSRIYVMCDKYEGENAWHHETYLPTGPLSELAKGYGHGASDFYTMHNFIEKIRGNDTDTIDVYEALDMFLPGLFANRSILNGGVPMAVPDLRKKELRDAWRNDKQPK